MGGYAPKEEEERILCPCTFEDLCRLPCTIRQEEESNCPGRPPYSLPPTIPRILEPRKDLLPTRLEAWRSHRGSRRQAQGGCCGGLQGTCLTTKKLQRNRLTAANCK